MLVFYAILHCLTILQWDGHALREDVAPHDVEVVDEALADVVEPIQSPKKRARQLPVADTLLADSPAFLNAIDQRTDASPSDHSWGAKRQLFNLHQLAQPPPGRFATGSVRRA